MTGRRATEHWTPRPTNAKPLNEKYLRLAAGVDNYKQTHSAIQQEQIKFGNEQILRTALWSTTSGGHPSRPRELEPLMPLTEWN